MGSSVPAPLPLRLPSRLQTPKLQPGSGMPRRSLSTEGNENSYVAAIHGKAQAPHEVVLSCNSTATVIGTFSWSNMLYQPVHIHDMKSRCMKQA